MVTTDEVASMDTAQVQYAMCASLAASYLCSIHAWSRLNEERPRT